MYYYLLNQFCWLTFAFVTSHRMYHFLSSPKEDAQSAQSQDLDCIKFFSFSLIDGYISLVMDTEAQRQ